VSVARDGFAKCRFGSTSAPERGFTRHIFTIASARAVGEGLLAEPARDARATVAASAVKETSKSVRAIRFISPTSRIRRGRRLRHRSYADDMREELAKGKRPTGVLCARVHECPPTARRRAITVAVRRGPAFYLAGVLLGCMLLIVNGATAAGGELPRCHTTALAVSLGRFGVGLGNATTEVALRNSSHHACFVYGYAGFGLQNAHHGEQRSRVIWGNTYFQTDRRPHRVVLRPGRRAYTNLAWSDNPGPGENLRGPCEPVSAWLEVTPPDEYTFLLVRFGQRVCARGNLFATALSATAKPPTAP
jgi:hypothetical protein